VPAVNRGSDQLCEAGGAASVLESIGLVLQHGETMQMQTQTASKLAAAQPAEAQDLRSARTPPLAQHTLTHEQERRVAARVEVEILRRGLSSQDRIKAKSKQRRSALSHWISDECPTGACSHF
jgi:hypothetical protein